MQGDDCNADGYVTNLYTATIGSISADGNVPVYAETCSSILAVTFSGGTSVLENENIIVNLKKLLKL